MTTKGPEHTRSGHIGQLKTTTTTLRNVRGEVCVVRAMRHLGWEDGRLAGGWARVAAVVVFHYIHATAFRADVEVVLR